MKLQGGMMRSIVDCSKAQFKIQEMAFVVVMIMIFFGLGSVIVLGIIGNTASKEVSLQRAEEAKEIVRKIAVSPELIFVENGCDSCLDMDKAMAVKYNDKYDKYWDLEYLKIVTLYPNKTGECTKTNFPECESITLVENKTSNYGVTQSSFVALCRYEKSQYYKCELGKVIAAGRYINSS